MNLRDQISLLLDTDEGDHNDENIKGYNEAVKDILALIGNARTVTQPEKVMSKLDLENPPERLVTSTGKEAQLIGNTGKGTHPFVVQIKRKLYPSHIYSNRDGSSTVATSTFEPSLTTLHAAQVKKTGWINLYDSQGGETHCPSARTYSTRELAIEAAETLPLIDTIHIKWEE